MEVIRLAIAFQRGVKNQAGGPKDIQERQLGEHRRNACIMHADAVVVPCEAFAGDFRCFPELFLVRVFSQFRLRNYDTWGSCFIYITTGDRSTIRVELCGGGNQTSCSKIRMTFIEKPAGGTLMINACLVFFYPGYVRSVKTAID